MTEEDDATFGRRLGRVETGLARHDARFDDVDRRLSGIERTQESTNAGVQELLRREAGRPQPTNMRTAITTVGAVGAVLGMLATFSWWFTAVSPPIVALQKQLGDLTTAIDKRLTRIDDPEIGRLPRVEKRLDDVERWRPTVTVAK